jgi:hypothetical protein
MDQAVQTGELIKEDKIKKKRGRFSSKKSFWICCSGVSLAGGAPEEKEKKTTEKEKEKVDLKLKKKAFLCCSNVEFDQTEEEKVLQYLENNTKKSCVMMCWSNFEVGTKSGLGHKAPK